MEEISTLLLNQLVVPLVSFFFGVLIGWVLGRATKESFKISTNTFVQLVIFALWASSVTRGLVDLDYTTPRELHIFMGIVLGAMNDNIGKFIIDLWKSKK